MVNLVKILSTEWDNFHRRVVKFLRFGQSDVQTCLEAAPYGVDANPIKDMVAIYATSVSREEKIILGYINKKQIAAPGEHRLFSTDSSGEVQTFLWLQNDGTLQLGGEEDHAVRYQPLYEELQNFKNLVGAELSKAAAGIAAAGGSYTPGELTLDISKAKIDNIKTP